MLKYSKKKMLHFKVFTQITVLISGTHIYTCFIYLFSSWKYNIDTDQSTNCNINHLLIHNHRILFALFIPVSFTVTEFSVQVTECIFYLKTMGILNVFLQAFSSTFLLGALTVLLLIYLISSASFSTQDPPGPRPLPLFGNLLQMNLKRPYKTLLEVR